MPQSYTREQLEKLKSLGIDVSGLAPNNSTIPESPQPSQPLTNPQPSAPNSIPESQPFIPAQESESSSASQPEMPPQTDIKPELLDVPETETEIKISTTPDLNQKAILTEVETESKPEPEILIPDISADFKSAIDEILEEIPSPSVPALAVAPSQSKKGPTVVPLLSISGFTILSFGGLLLLKAKNTSDRTIPKSNQTPSSQVEKNQITPTQVPKSIQHYLLTSQQFFSQAIQLQNSGSTDPNQTVNLINQSILAATQAIKEFPSDSRGYYQRGKIYQSLVDSKPELLSQTITDLAMAQKLNPESAEITHDLAAAFAKKGDAKNTIAYLSKTVSLDPTKAQNFYDLAKIEQQAGMLPQALDTYNRLLTLITDPAQKTQVESEKAALENLIAQNPDSTQIPIPSISDPSDGSLQLPDNPPTLEAMVQDNNGLIIAAPETEKKIEVTNQTDSNSLSGTATLPSGQKEMTIQNSKLTSASQVYVSIMSGGKNQTLQVLSKASDSFVVGFDSPLNEDVQFKWWIIN
jgi:tetratricopeptide (TPR) repeat protein